MYEWWFSQCMIEERFVWKVSIEKFGVIKWGATSRAKSQKRAAKVDWVLPEKRNVWLKKNEPYMRMKVIMWCDQRTKASKCERENKNENERSERRMRDYCFFFTLFLVFQFLHKMDEWECEKETKVSDMRETI